MVVFLKDLKAQYGVPDTLTYLHNIVNNKNQYIGQYFSVLQNSLNIQVKYFHPRRGVTYDTDRETSTKFSFYFPDECDDLYLASPYLEIYWLTPLNAIQSFLLYNSNNGGGWNTAVYNFYKNAIIRDIKVRE